MTHDQFGVDKFTFDLNFKGKDLEVLVVTSMFTYVTAPGLPETYAIAHDDLQPKTSAL